MAIPSRAEEWFQLVPHLILEEGWETVMDGHGGHGSLQRSWCPWGGALLKLKVQVMVEEALETPAHLLVRPEVRALHRRHLSELDDRISLLRQTAPGEALLEQIHSWGVSSLCSSFFEAAHRPKDLSDTQFSRRSWQRLSRDFPEEGDCALSISTDSASPSAPQRASLLLCRGVDARDATRDERGVEGCHLYELNAIFDVSEEQFDSWTSIELRLLLDSASRMAQWSVNRPGITELRAADRDFYTLLTVQSCRRGLPLLPCRRSSDAARDAARVASECEEVVVTINDGKELGLDRWTRYDPGRYAQEKFGLAQYIRLFLENQKIHNDFEAFEELDGCQLVSFQCVVRTSEWDQVKTQFYSAFLMQKKAYRHLNGGSTAPSIREGGKARMVRNEMMSQLAEQMQKFKEREASQHKVVVRRTFLDVQEQNAVRSKRRYRTTSVLVNAF